MKKIQVGLGTVQLGVPYGTNQHAPLMPEEEAFRILTYAVENGISFIDTAASYGESEARIGKFISQHPIAHFDISTKIPTVDKEIWSSEKKYLSFIHQSIEKSKKNLGVSGIHLLQLHQCNEDFLQHTSVKNVLSTLLEEKICQKIGVSIYDENQAELSLEIPSVSALQIPLNIIDQRLISPKMLRLYAKKGTFLLARSILFQGILAKEYQPPKVKKQHLLQGLRNIIELLVDKDKIATLAFQFCFNNMSDFIDIGLIGVNSKKELEENLTAIQGVQLAKELQLPPLSEAKEFATENNLLNPSKWNQ